MVNLYIQADNKRQFPNFYWNKTIFDVDTHDVQFYRETLEIYQVYYKSCSNSAACVRFLKG